jgi:EAL and modified HD-GYP domain-containing signal transduction protein
MTAAFIARQPIFNPKLDVVGYELLFRGRGHAADALIENPERATATVVLNSFTELDLKRIVGNKTAWVNVTREFVLGGLVEVIPPHLGGLEVPELELFDDEMIAALHDLKSRGYRLALDDFRYRPGSEELLDLFDVVKLNMLELGREQLSEQVERLRPYGGLLLADKLETRADHEFCIGAGCDLFQGYFFCRPAVVGTRGIAANRLALLQVVAALHAPDVELSDIEQLITRDVALSFRMLRYVNSAFFGLRSDVRSIGQALALLGVANVRRWTTLSVLASIDDKPTELTATALIRARFCELAGERLNIGSPAELFTLGLFSVIDGMMDAPMHDVVASLPLADDMREALVMRRGPKGQLLDCVASLETGDYGADAMVPGADELYLKALVWANTAGEALFGKPAGASAQTATETASSDGVATVPTAAQASQSKPPPVSERAPGDQPSSPSVELADVSELDPKVASDEGGLPRRRLVGRVLASCSSFIRRRLGDRRDDGGQWDQGAHENA